MYFLRKKEVLHRVKLSDSQIARLEKSGNFPKRVQLGPKVVGWPEHEIDAWMTARMDARQDD